MKRFKNVLTVYDLTPGGDVTLERGIALARRNGARLTLLHVVEPGAGAERFVAERRRVLSRVASGIDLAIDRMDTVVRQGGRAAEILRCAGERMADLIVVSDEGGDGLSRLLGTDTVADLMRHAACPVWVVRPNERRHYGQIVAAVDAGRPDAQSCPSVRRTLELAASLAEREGAALDVLYAWDFQGRERETLQSELPPGGHDAMVRAARFRHLERVAEVTRAVLGDPVPGVPVVGRGTPEAVITRHVQVRRADLLVMGGSAGAPLFDAFTGRSALRLLHGIGCSVLISRPIPLAAAADRRLAS